MDIVESLVTAVLGGGTGLLGSVVGRVAGYFEEKQKLKRLEVELAHEIRLQEMTLADKKEERESHLSAVYAEQDTLALRGSYEHDVSYTDSYLRWVRPVLTLILLLLTTGVYFTVEGEDVEKQVATQIVYFTCVAVSWWFADRSGRVKR